MPRREILEERALIARNKAEAKAAREAAAAAKVRWQAKCPHSWHMISHEERRCQRCGAIDFVPDLD